MNAFHDQLASQCALIQSEMSAIAGAIKALGASPRGAGFARPAGSASQMSRGRTRRGGKPIRGPRGEGNSLKDYIRKVVASGNSPLRVVEIASGVVKAGYQTSSSNLSNQVSMALADMTKKKLVRKVDRGTYTV